MRLAIVCLTILIGLTACKKDKLDIIAYWECNKLQNLDSTGISAKLLGSWRWALESCPYAGYFQIANMKVTLTFKGDGTFSIKDGSNVVREGKWMLARADANSWHLDATSLSDFLYGRILFCDNQLLFYDSDRDACDNLFYKSK